MADRTSDDDPGEDLPADDASDDTAAEDTAAGDDETTTADDARRKKVAAPTKTKGTSAPADPKADVAARRAATKARMDAAGPTKASADDPTGAKARRRGATGTMGKASATDPTGAKARKAEATSSKKVPRPSKRTGGAVDDKAVRRSAARSGNPKKVAEAVDSTRYTAPIPRSQLESPQWVPILMFALLGAGMVVIFLTYVLWEGRPLALGVGLACILGGILAATQYR